MHTSHVQRAKPTCSNVRMYRLCWNHRKTCVFPPLHAVFAQFIWELHAFLCCPVLIHLLWLICFRCLNEWIILSSQCEWVNQMYKLHFYTYVSVKHLRYLRSCVTCTWDGAIQSTPCLPRRVTLQRSRCDCTAWLKVACMPIYHT